VVTLPLGLKRKRSMPWLWIIPALIAGLAAQLYPLAVAGVLAFVVLCGVFAIWPEWFAWSLILYTAFEPMLLRLAPAGAQVYMRLGMVDFILAAGLGAIVFWKGVRGTPLHRAPFDALLLLFILAGLVSGLVNGVGLLPMLLGLRILLRFVLVYYILINSALSPRSIKQTIALVIAVVVLEIGVGLFQAVTRGTLSSLFVAPGLMVALSGTEFSLGGLDQVTDASLFIFGTLGKYNYYGIFMAIGLSVVLGLYYRYLGDRRWAMVLLAITALVILYAGARAAWLGAAGAVLVLAYLAADWRALRAIVAGVMILSAMLIVALPTIANLPFPDLGAGFGLWERIVQTIHPDTLLPAPDSNIRLYSIVVVTQALLEHYPILGIGPGTFGSALSEGASFYEKIWFTTSSLTYTSDVEYVTVLAQYGLVGLGLYLALLFRVLESTVAVARKSQDRFLAALALGAVGACIVLMIGSWAGPFLESRNVAFYFWLLPGLVMSSQQLQERGRSRERS